MEIAKEQALSDPAFSIIVPVRNRWGPRLRNCMRSLGIQTLQPLEIIVVDYGSTEQGHEAMMKTLDDFDCSVYYYRTDEVWSLAIARNAGIRRSSVQCRNVAAIDADLILEPRVMEALAKAHESRPRSYISCFIFMLVPKVWPHFKEFMKACVARRRPQPVEHVCLTPNYVYDPRCRAEYRKLYPSNLDETPDSFELPQNFAVLKERKFWPSAGWGGLVSAPRSWLFRVRGFDERMKLWGAEDRDLWKRAGLDNMDRYRINDLKQEDTAIYHQFHDDGLSWDQSRLTKKGKAQIEWNKLLAEKDYTLMRNNDTWGLWRPPRSKNTLRIKDVRKAYEVYTETVSEAGWAISWKVSTFLISLMDEVKLDRILDLGSGWSSYLLRLGGAEVWSIETDAKWLEKTKSFLTQFDQLNGHFGLLEDFEFPTEQTYDLVLVDTKPGARRYEMFPSIKRCCKGIVVFDDWNNDKIREPAKKVFGDWIIQNLEKETKDRWGRLIAVAYRGKEYHAVIDLLKRGISSYDDRFMAARCS